MVCCKSVFPKLRSNPTRVWDTFAEPNNLNNTECSFRTKSGLIAPYGATSPKKQVNRRRLRMKAAQNLSFWGSETPLQIQWAFLFFPGQTYSFALAKIFLAVQTASTILTKSSIDVVSLF